MISSVQKKKGPKAASINEISDKENKKVDLDGDESPGNIYYFCILINSKISEYKESK